jgi:hypothetical protein
LSQQNRNLIFISQQSASLRNGPVIIGEISRPKKRLKC